MKQSVHILATVRKAELLEAALLVFRTLRVGFPDAIVNVWGNNLFGSSLEAVAAATGKVGGQFRNLGPTSHDVWIESLLQESLAPFWICDTDVVFWDPVELWFSMRDVDYAGRHEPGFNEEWTDTFHVERLHTCLMYLNPEAIRNIMRKFMAKIPQPWRNSADFPFIQQHFVPVKNSPTLFYDTCAGLYQAQTGTAFTEHQDEAFDHLHCATYADLVQLDGVQLKAAHQAVYRDHTVARGIRKQQDAYYARRQPKGTPKHKNKYHPERRVE